MDILTRGNILEIEQGISKGKILTLIPIEKGKVRVCENRDFLSPEESERLLANIARPTTGTYLEHFIWEYEEGIVEKFAEKICYHPNRISNLKSQLKAEDKPVPIRLFHRMAKTYNLDKNEKGF